jgi:hypothetical protein
MATEVLLSRSHSGCCRAASIIVRSREGGFVTQNCSACGRPRAVTPSELPQRFCERCESELEVVLREKNYTYHCRTCNSFWEVATLVPHWSELFSEFGYGLDSDFEH